MVYKFQRTEPEILAHDEYKGYEYYILSLGTYPCAYVVLTKKDRLFRKDYDSSVHIQCHGGLTYSGDYFLNKHDDSKWVIGWDYAHLNDKTQYMSGKEWSTDEIYDEVKNVINQVIEYNDKVDKMMDKILEGDE